MRMSFNNHMMKNQDSTEPSAKPVADNTITPFTTSSKSSLSPAAVETLNNLCNINEQNEYERSTAAFPYSIVRVKHKSIRTILKSIDRVSILFGVQYMFISDGCDEIDSQSDDQTALMYFQPIASAKPALSDNKIDDLSKNLQVSFVQISDS